MKRKLFKLFYLLLGAIVLVSCKNEVADLITEEPVKDITGTWRIVSLSRNGEELSERLDLSKFKIIFNADGSYTLQDKMAFTVSGPGSYTLNDSQYPSGLILTEEGKAPEKMTFQFPVIAGKRQLSLTLNPGCPGNTYQYNFVREN
jgi:hypothetical protein